LEWVGHEIETFLGPEMATSKAGGFWAQKSRDFQGPPLPMALFCLRAMENCICGLRSIERNMRPNLRIEYLVYEVQAGSGVGGRGGQIMNSDQKVLPRQSICWLHSRPEYSGVYSRDMQQADPPGYYRGLYLHSRHGYICAILSHYQNVYLHIYLYLQNKLVVAGTVHNGGFCNGCITKRCLHNFII
jgi:hypothetical protein